MIGVSKIHDIFCELELCPIWPAVTPPTLLELCLAWPAVTPQHYLSCDAMGAKSNPPHNHRCIISLHAYSYNQQSGRSVKSMTAKNTKKITDSCECGREHNLQFW